MSRPRRAFQSHVVVEAPAKINVGLEILHRRPDGYHELVTVFQTMSLFDRIELYISEGSQPAGIKLDVFPRSLDLGSDEQNLVVLAARDLLREVGRAGQLAIRIRLRKSIPVGAGLGGGSADAAAVLIGLSHGLKLQRTPESLFSLARGLGADVPFFLFGGTRLGRGVGEVLTKVPPMPESWWVVVFPNVSVTTSSIFSDLKFGLTPPGPLARMARRKFPSDFWSKLSDDEIRNDLEAPILVAAPVVGEVLRELRSLGSPFAQVTGSGSAVYGRVSDRNTGRNWVQVLKRRGWWCRLLRPTRQGCRIQPPTTDRQLGRPD